MTLTRLRAAPAVVQLHGFAAMAAMVLGWRNLWHPRARGGIAGSAGRG